MNVTEAVEFMKQGNRVTRNAYRKAYRDDFWYQLYNNGSVYSLIQDTACAARIRDVWNTTDEFIKTWDTTENFRVFEVRNTTDEIIKNWDKEKYTPHLRVM